MLYTMDLYRFILILRWKDFGRLQENCTEVPFNAETKNRVTLILNSTNLLFTILQLSLWKRNLFTNTSIDIVSAHILVCNANTSGESKITNDINDDV